MESVFEGMTEYYSRELSQKVKRGLEISASKCKFLGGIRPFGYSIGEQKEFLINEYEAMWVRKIFELYALGKGSVEIEEMLNSHNVNTTNGKPFDINKLRRLIADRKYLGEYSFKGEIIKNRIPSIVDEETFKKANMIKDKKQQHYKTVGSPTEYFFSTKIYCACCGNKIFGHSGTNSTGKKQHYYRCEGVVKKKVCKLPSFKKEEFEDKIIKTVKKQLSDKEIETMVDEEIASYNSSKYDSRIDEINIKIKEKEIQIKKLTLALSQGRNLDVVMNAIDDIKKEKEGLENELAMLSRSKRVIDRNDLINRIKLIRDYSFDTPSNIAMFADSFIDEIMYTSKNNTL